MSAPDTPLEYLAQTGELPREDTEWPEVLYWLWLAWLLGPASSHAGPVLDEYGTAKAVWEDRDTDRFQRRIGAAALRRWRNTPCTPAEMRPLWDTCEDGGIQIVTFADEDYPLALSRIGDPPLVLYCTGDVKYLNSRRTVGMVGSRKPTHYGVDAAALLGSELARSGAVIISGLADGLDSECHRAAVSAGKPTIGVLGVPINKTYPAANLALRAKIEARGTVISEYGPGTAPDHRVSFLQRNRIIAALSQVLVVLEARERSGTMNTVAHAERYGRKVFAVPGSIFSPLSEGTNGLLRAGRARMATSAADILEQMGLRRMAAGTSAKPASAPKPLSDNARMVLNCIGARPIGLEQLAEKTGLGTGALLVALTSLELSGWIAAQPGQRYILK